MPQKHNVRLKTETIWRLYHLKKPMETWDEGLMAILDEYEKLVAAQ